MSIERGSEYVAMGSSFAAGPGLRPRTGGAPRASGRSDSNYAHIAARRLGLSLTDVTFSGATTADILEGSRNRVAQIDAVTDATRLVTVTAGGNDIGYLPALTFASFPWPARSLPALRHRVTGFVDAVAMSGRFADLGTNLATLVAKVQERAPEARIVLVDYLTILPPKASMGARLDTLRSNPGGDLVAWGRGVADRLSDTFASVASAANCDFLDVGLQSKDHHAWSPSPWTRQFHLSLRGGAPYHPNAEGMIAVADMLMRKLGR